MHRAASKFIAILSASALVASQILVPISSARAQAALAISQADYDACQTQREQDFRTAVEAITKKSLAGEAARIDYGAIVREGWRKAEVGQVIDTRVDLAEAEVREETGWGQLLKSLAYREKAQELATAVAERVYRSDAVKQAIEGLAGSVGTEIGRAIEAAALEAAQPTQRCVRLFLGPRFGDAVADSVVRDTSAAFSVDPAEGAASVSGASLLQESSGGLAGAVVLVVRRQLANLASRLGQRMIGAVLGRLVAVVAGGIGIVLIAKDIWDLRYGVLPIIASEMKSEATKAKVQEELAAAISQQVGEQMNDIARQTAERVVDIWRQFRAAHAKVLDLAEADGEFRSYLGDLSASQLARLDEIVALILAEDGEPGVKRRLADGSLQQALASLPEGGLRIARELRSLDRGLKWTALAGDKLGQVIANGLYQRSAPGDFTVTTLERLLALEDQRSIARLAALERSQREALFELEVPALKKLARALEQDELGALARYQSGLSPAARQRVLNSVAEQPAKMQLLAEDGVRDAIVGSRDQDAAVRMMLRDTTLVDPRVVAEDMQLVLDGAVRPILLWKRHPVAIVFAGVVTLILLLVLRSLLFRRRPAGV